MRVKLSSKNIFLIISLALAIILGLFSYYIAKSQFTSYLSDSYKDNIYNYTNSLAVEYFELSKATSLRQSGHQAEFINSLTKNTEIKKASLSDANGTIIASTNDNEINSVLLDDTAWQAAIKGKSQLANLNESSKQAKFYVPIISNTGVTKGVLIIEAELPHNFATIQSFTNTVVFTIVGAALVFIFIAYIIMVELETRMDEKERYISDKSRAQTEEKQLYEAITTSLAEALVVINKNNQIMFINPEAEKMLDTKSSEVEYRSYEKIITFYNEEGKKIRHNPVSESITKGHVIHVSLKDNYYIKNGKNIIPVALNIAPIVGSKSFVKGVALTINDVSSEKELQKVKDEFVYVVAHELGNPIFALDGYLSLLQDRTKKIDKQSRDILSGARDINTQLSSLVNDLLEVSRNETGRLTFDLSPIDISALTNEVIKNSHFKAHEKKITLNLKKDNVPKVTGNEQKIREVVTNLVDNAIKYTPKNGHIDISIFKHDNYVITSVKDSGIGISPDNQKQLFQKFFRVKNKATEGISGTGLGLFIAKQIVEKCHGEMWATSEEGKGSNFSFSLKIAKEKK